MSIEEKRSTIGITKYVVTGILIISLSACTSNRFVSISDQSVHHSHDLAQYQALPDFSGSDYTSLKQLCQQYDEKQNYHPAFSVYCAYTWLQHNDLADVDKDEALLLYNSALFALLKLQFANKAGTTPANLKVVVKGEHLNYEHTYLTHQFKPLDEDLILFEHGKIGVSAVAMRKNQEFGRDTFYPLEGVFRPLTFLVSDIKREDELIEIAIQSIGTQGASMPPKTAMGFQPKSSSSAAYLLLLEHANIDDFSFTGLINPSKAEDRRGVFAIEALSSTKIPILMTHGLKSDPLIWQGLTLAILNDQCLHEHFQVWHSYYPSGPPPFYSSMMLRRKLNQLLDEIDEPSLISHGVFIGHSMGGIISKTMTTSSEYRLWDATFNKRPDHMSPPPSDYIQDIFIFSPLFEHNTVFFIDTPHQGSQTARSAIGYLGSALVTLPDAFLDIFRDFIKDFGDQYLTRQMRPFLQDYGPNSVQVLRPGHPLMQNLYDIPVQGEAFSVIGSTGAVSCEPESDCEFITDGVVDYNSAYLPDAKDTIIVPSSHDSFRSPVAIRYILEQLKKHPRLNGQCLDTSH